MYVWKLNLRNWLKNDNWIMFGNWTNDYEWDI